MKRKENDKCCNTCPFLKENFGKPTPNPDAENIEHDWYTEDNMRRVFEGIAGGDPMICHSTDIDSKDYGFNAKIKPGKEKYCTGALIIQFRHIKIFERIGLENEDMGADEIYRLYLQEAGDNAMTLRGIREVVMYLAIGRTSPIGGLYIPASTGEEREVCLQWDCNISNKD